jgi:hypothetical protein
MKTTSPPHTHTRKVEKIKWTVPSTLMYTSGRYCHCVYLFSILNILCDGRSTSTTPVPTCVPDNSHTDRWSQEDFPNPQIDISKCGRNCKAYINECIIFRCK